MYQDQPVTLYGCMYQNITLQTIISVNINNKINKASKFHKSKILKKYQIKLMVSGEAIFGLVPGQMIKSPFGV